MKKIFTRTEIENITPSFIRMPQNERRFLAQITIVGLKKILLKAKEANYTKKEIDIAWDEAFERKVCDMSVTQDEEVNFQEALEIYFEHLTCNDMKHYKPIVDSIFNE